MEFGLDAGQLQLQETVATFCANRFPADALGRHEALPVDRGFWAELADLGLLGCLADSSLKTTEGDLGVVEAALLFEQLGFHLIPGPVLWTVLAAGLVDGAGSGEQVVGGVAAAAISDDAAVVEYAASLDVLIVLADDGVLAHRVIDLAAPHPLDPFDPLTPVGRFSGLTGGAVVGDEKVAARMLLLGTVLSAALLAGIGARALEVARTYATEREQFGVAIGTFQAVKHLLADMYVRSTLAQSATYAAAAMVQDPGQGDPSRAAARAKLLAAETAVANASTAVQILGGMGFTWDMLPNYLLKRAWVLEHSFGTAEAHAVGLGSSLAADLATAGSGGRHQ